MRQVLAVVIGAAVAALGGLILGEYPFTGITPYAAGLLFGLVVAEVIVSVGGQVGPIAGVASAVCTVGGLGWAIWISSGRGVSPIPGGAWAGLGVGVVVAALRGGLRIGVGATQRTTGSRTRDEPPSPSG